MRNEIRQILKQIVSARKRIVIDNDFERAFGVPFIEAKPSDLVEAIAILDSILNENNIDINEIFELGE